MDWNPTFFVEIVWNKENQKVVHLLRIKKRKKSILNPELVESRRNEP
jgi:hypothetical protein